MAEKEVFAALEITDYEVRLVAAELHNFKLNVLKVERRECGGVDSGRIVNADAVIFSIREAVSEASRLIGATIRNLILVIPSVNARSYFKRITVPCESGSIQDSDVMKALQAATKSVDDPHSEFVNIVPLRYGVNGYTSRRLPLAEKSEQLAVETEILTAEKRTVYAYVEAVEKAGYNVSDICLDSFAVATEASLFERSVEKYLLLVQMERKTTTLSLLNQGRILQSMLLDKGYGQIIGKIADTYHLPLDICARLLLYNARLMQEKLPDSPIYYWTVDSISHTLSEKELVELVKPEVKKMLEEIKEISGAILEREDCEVILCGSGAMMQDVSELSKEMLGRKTEVYIPETIGVRTGSLSACMGAIYAYIDKKSYLKKPETAISDQEYRALYESILPAQSQEDTLSNRFKKIFTKN